MGLLGEEGPRILFAANKCCSGVDGHASVRPSCKWMTSGRRVMNAIWETSEPPGLSVWVCPASGMYGNRQGRSPPAGIKPGLQHLRPVQSERPEQP